MSDTRCWTPFISPPQRRRRLYIVGIRTDVGDPFQFPRGTGERYLADVLDKTEDYESPLNRPTGKISRHILHKEIQRCGNEKLDWKNTPRVLDVDCSEKFAIQSSPVASTLVASRTRGLWLKTFAPLNNGSCHADATQHKTKYNPKLIDIRTEICAHARTT